MIQPPDRPYLNKLRDERDASFKDFRKVCNQSADAKCAAFDSAKAAADVAAVKQAAVNHPFISAAVVMAGTAIAVKLIRRMPIKSLAVTGLTMAARYYVPKLIHGYMEQRERAELGGQHRHPNGHGSKAPMAP